MLKEAALAAVIACGSLGAMAADAPEGAHGVGLTRCSDFRKILNSDPQFAKNMFKSWAEGFMAGSNSERIDEKKPLVIVNAKSDANLFSYLTLYCDKNPREPFVLGVMELYLSLPTQSK